MLLAQAARTPISVASGRSLLHVTAVTLLILAVASGAAFASGGSYPKLANYYFSQLDETDLERLSRWDVLVLGKRAQDLHQPELLELKSLNPSAELLAHVAVSYHGGWDRPPINAGLTTALDENDWWLKDDTGQRVPIHGGADYINVTSWCPTSPSGQQFADWFPEYVYERIVAGGLWDGVFLDLFCDRISWACPSIDADGNGIADDPDELNEAWRQGIHRVAMRLRELAGDDFIIMTNGNNTAYEWCNGSMREDFPNMHGDWYDNIMDEEHGYVAIDSLFREERVNIVNVMWRGVLDLNGDPIRSNIFERVMRFTLASTLVFGDGYFSFDRGGGVADHQQMWWHELYDIDLGTPMGPAIEPPANPGVQPWIQLGNMIRLRRYSNGVAVVNPSSTLQVVGLTGTYYVPQSWNGQFYSAAGARTAMELVREDGTILVGNGRQLHGAIEFDARNLAGQAVLLRWPAVAEATGYSIYRSEDPDVPMTPETLVTVTGHTFYLDDSVVPKTTYSYRVAPIDDHLFEGQPSHPVEVTTTLGSDLSVEARAGDRGGRLALTWETDANLPFEVYKIGESGEREALACGPLWGPGELTCIDDAVEPGAVYDYEIVTEVGGAPLTVGYARGSVAASADLPASLFPCSPNPTISTTTFSFDISPLGRAARADLTIYDVSGRKVRGLLSSHLPPGRHSVYWDGLDSAGKQVASGCYLYTLTVEGVPLTRKLVLLK